jgi:carbonic anhydrase/acetyltransferase-like protein (isoleucine patch superfamily)
MVGSFEGRRPDIARAAFVAASADLSGEVELGDGASVWYGAVLRADLAPIRVGAGSNVQDGAVVHVDEKHPCVLGEDVTVGHRAILHGCAVGDRSLVGMGAILLDGSSIGEESIVGAGALVTQGKSFPPRSLILGSPAKVARELESEEIAGLREHARAYVDLARRTAQGSRKT